MGCSGSKAGGGGGGGSATDDNKILTDDGQEPLTKNQLKPFNAFFSMLFEPLPGAQVSGEGNPIMNELMAPDMEYEHERRFNQADLDSDGKLTKAEGEEWFKLSC